MDHERPPPNKSNSTFYSNKDEEERWGTWVMGNPAAPQAHPVNQQAATWVASASDPANSNSGYINYSAYPPPSFSSQYLPPQPANPYVHSSPAGGGGKRPMDAVLDVFGRWGKKVEKTTRKAEGFAGNVWQHLKTGPSLGDAAMARLAQGTKVLAEGGHDKVFQQTFDILPGEKLKKSYACYLSTLSGPVIGTLYVTTGRIAFCSDNPLCCTPYSGQQEWNYYKVVIRLDQLSSVNPSANRLNPAEKYIQIVTVDGYEFWFMGFVSYEKALKALTEALQSNPAHSSAIPIYRSS